MFKCCCNHYTRKWLIGDMKPGWYFVKKRNLIVTWFLWYWMLYDRITMEFDRRNTAEAHVKCQDHPATLNPWLGLKALRDLAVRRISANWIDAQVLCCLQRRGITPERKPWLGRFKIICFVYIHTRPCRYLTTRPAGQFTYSTNQSHLWCNAIPETCHAHAVSWLHTTLTSECYELAHVSIHH